MNTKALGLFKEQCLFESKKLYCFDYSGIYGISFLRAWVRLKYITTSNVTQMIIVNRLGNDSLKAIINIFFATCVIFSGSPVNFTNDVVF